MNQEWQRTLVAMRRAAEGDPGKPGSAQRLSWVLQGAAGWRLRAIAREENFPSSRNDWIVRHAVSGGQVRHILKVYLAGLEKRLLVRRAQ